MECVRAAAGRLAMDVSRRIIAGIWLHFQTSSDNLADRLALNRHQWWPSITVGYLEDWNRTRAAEDMEFLDRTVVDWISWSGRAPTLQNETSTGANHQRDWLTLDAGIRLGCWPSAFFVAAGTEIFRDSTLLLMVASLIDQSAYITKFGGDSGNWAATDDQGMLTAAIAFPELTPSQVWFDTAIDRSLSSLRTDVYLDGVEDEMASGYGEIVAADL